MEQSQNYPKERYAPADLRQAYELLEYCMQHNIVIDVSRLDNPRLVADLMLVKCIELSKYR